ncbi:MAG: NAD(P)H-binding protein [Gammaproteobacteria bacterium]|nr:NAD(P)H-binding protein [Gammaproteobacteria bacterium]MYG67796.1 NAD(P)H-binding protein [Gammaproteobacteria bacterium]
MKVLLTGATGMVGSLVLQQNLDNQDILEVVSLLRRPSGVQHPKLTELVIKNFLSLEEVATFCQGIDAVYYCQGVYTGTVDHDLFRQITIDYPEALAKIIKTTSPDARFCLLSGAGADRSGRSRVAFARDKGEIENRLSNLGLGAFHSFRAGYIFPVTPRQEPNLGYRLLRLLYPFIRLFGEGSSIRSTELAEAMFRVGLQGHTNEILENKDIIAVIR